MLQDGEQVLPYKKFSLSDIYFFVGRVTFDPVKVISYSITIISMLVEQQSPTILDPVDNTELEALRAVVKTITEENESIKRSLVENEKLLNEQRGRVDELKKQLKQKDDIVQQQKSKMEEEQSKISKLTIQLSKVEKLLQKLLQKKQKNEFSQGSYFTPQVDKYRKGFQISSKIQQNYTIKSPQRYNIGSHRSSKTQFSSSKKSPMLATSSYLSKIQNSPSSSYHQYGTNYQSQQFKKYRRQMLMASQNVQDVLKLEKMMSKHSLM